MVGNSRGEKRLTASGKAVAAGGYSHSWAGSIRHAWGQIDRQAGALTQKLWTE